jgi:hypothetical protein
MEGLLTEKIANPRGNFGPGAVAVVRAVIELIESEGGGLGGEQATDPNAHLRPRESQPQQQQSNRGGSAGGGGGGGGKQGSRSGGADTGRRLNVQGLPRGQANEAELRKIFSAAGRVESVHLILCTFSCASCHDERVACLLPSCAVDSYLRVASQVPDGVVVVWPCRRECAWLPKPRPWLGRW